MMAPHPCSACGATFANDGLLRRHVKKDHPPVPATLPDLQAIVEPGKPSLVQALEQRVLKGMPMELAAQAEMLGPDWRSTLTDQDVAYLRRAEAIFFQETIGRMLTGSHDQVTAAKAYLELFGKAFNARRKQVKYVAHEYLDVASRHIDPGARWEAFLDDLAAHDTEEVVREIDRVLNGVG